MTRPSLFPATLEARYAPSRELGRGSASVVFLAADRTSGQQVVVKVLHRADAEMRARLRREAELMTRIRHVSVPDILEAEAAGDLPYLITPFHPGEMLTERLSRGALDAPGALALARELLDGLAAIHDAGILHRDIKPANIRLPDTGPAQLIDFGISMPEDAERLTPDGTTVGTVAYMAPEQIVDGTVSRQSDLFSLGATLVEARTGIQPFLAASLDLTMRRVINVRFEDAVLPFEPRPLFDALRSMLGKEPAKRPADARSVLARLPAVCPAPGPEPDGTPAMPPWRPGPR